MAERQLPKLCVGVARLILPHVNLVHFAEVDEMLLADLIDCSTTLEKAVSALKRPGAVKATRMSCRTVIRARKNLS